MPRRFQKRQMNLAASSPTAGFIPPRGLRLVSSVEWARIMPTPPDFVLKSRGQRRTAQERSARRLAGIRYERRVQRNLFERYDNYIPSPWIMYKERHSPHVRWAQLDGFLFLPSDGTIVLVEIKHQHCNDAWWQLRRKYLPLMQALFPEWKFGLCEVVRWFDPHVQMPETFRLVSDVHNTRHGEFSVHILTP